EKQNEERRIADAETARLKAEAEAAQKQAEDEQRAKQAEDQKDAAEKEALRQELLNLPQRETAANQPDNKKTPEIKLRPASSLYSHLQPPEAVPYTLPPPSGWQRFKNFFRNSADLAEERETKTEKLRNEQKVAAIKQEKRLAAEEKFLEIEEELGKIGVGDMAMAAAVRIKTEEIAQI
ncbi:hypothetical protein HY224_03175, partial [Candidatus Uhrbacteria bacterium]|nr:hypothetical protein [Candidatus Uhrbacteria bacterium]